MTSQEKDISTAIPDLRDIPADQLATLSSSVLANSIALYRERLKDNGIPLSSFQARIQFSATLTGRGKGRSDYYTHAAGDRVHRAG